ncbi:hypothetical protein [Patulibacter sp.]|uniref:hypothetical protein n=1 Tax=Patulibacter sp. TaxID=1912859 RepID=UPI002722C36D|nr:hypothetical protein [Patulibacter sp.]MDO9408566.1 hypothetical protein [Patulibacter sp.]
MQEAFGHRAAPAAPPATADTPVDAVDSPAPAAPGSPEAAVALLDAFLADLDAVVHRPAPLERGFALGTGAWPLHVGARAVGGLLELQAEVAPPGAVDAAWLLHRNRRDVRVVRYASSAEGATWVHGDLVLSAVSPATLDDVLARMLGAAEEAAAVAVWPDWG